MFPNRTTAADAIHRLPVVNRRLVGPGNLLTLNPVLQGSMFRPQIPGVLAGARHYSPKFLASDERSSLLGPVPMGPLPRQVGFPAARYSHPRGSHVREKPSVRFRERQKISNVASGGVDGWITLSQKERTGGKEDERDISKGVNAQSPFPSKLHGEPVCKRKRTKGSEEAVKVSEKCHAGQNPAEVSESESKLPSFQNEGKRGPNTEETTEHLEQRAAEVLGVGTSLKVTIQRSSESRAFSTGNNGSSGSSDPDGDREKHKAAGKFHCHICNNTCHNQQDFQTHMSGLEHQQCMEEIQRRSTACLVTLLPHMQNTPQDSNTHGERRRSLQRWCATCQRHFSGDLIKHRQTKEHKMSKQSSRPFCTVCERHFRTPRKFVEHMKSPEHKQRAEELREDGEPDILEELITIDAIGCFEGEDDYEEEPAEEDEMVTTFEHDGHKEVTLEDMTDCEEYNSDTQYGASFVIPVAGFLCRLCHKFFHFESTARETHCKSLIHFQSLQKYRALKIQMNSTQEEIEKINTFSHTVGNPGVNAAFSSVQEEVGEVEHREESSQSDLKRPPLDSSTQENHRPSIAPQKPVNQLDL